MLPCRTAAKYVITAIPMETHELFFFLCMIVPSLDFDALAVLFLKAVTLAVPGEHVGMRPVTLSWAVALALGCFASGVQAPVFHPVPLQWGGQWDDTVEGSVLLHGLGWGWGRGLYCHARFCLSWTSE